MDVTALLTNARSPDQATRQAAEAQIEQAKASNLVRSPHPPLHLHSRREPESQLQPHRPLRPRMLSLLLCCAAASDASDGRRAGERVQAGGRAAARGPRAQELRVRQGRGEGGGARRRVAAGGRGHEAADEAAGAVRAGQHHEGRARRGGPGDSGDRGHRAAKAAVARPDPDAGQRRDGRGGAAEAGLGDQAERAQDARLHLRGDRAGGARGAEQPDPDRRHPGHAQGGDRPGGAAGGDEGAAQRDAVHQEELRAGGRAQLHHGDRLRDGQRDAVQLDGDQGRRLPVHRLDRRELLRPPAAVHAGAVQPDARVHPGRRRRHGGGRGRPAGRRVLVDARRRGV